MRVHIIENNVIVNTIEASSIVSAQNYFPTSTCIAATSGTVGDSYVNSQIVPKTITIPVPQSVTRRQALQELLISGKLALVQPAIDAIADPLQRGLAQIEFNESQVFERNRPLLVTLCHGIGMTDSQIDELFIAASKL